MSTWTWTFIKPEYLSRNQIESLVTDAIEHTGGIYYKNYKERGWNYALKDWLKQHKENYDYFVNTCGVSPNEMTEKYLTHELRQRINDCEYKIECYVKILNNEMSFREMLEKTKENDITNYGYNHDFYIIKRNDDIYVNLKGEWWRNKRDSEDEFNTVESLIEEVRKSHNLGYYDINTNKWVDITELTPEFEKKLREYYGNIGDGNFYVHFG